MKELSLSKVGQGMLGASISGDGCDFRVWAPNARRIRVQLLDRSNNARELSMEPAEEGHFVLETSVPPGERYFYLVDDHQPVPDPVSRFLPLGVHGPTEIVAPKPFPWRDQHWQGLPLKDYVIYELHIGTFTTEGTFDAAIEKLPYLKKLGVTMVEIMPVTAFPGQHNWGYDGASPYAVQASYGGPEALRRLVNAAHAMGLGVILDVVYNHLGNEGNYLRLFGPYFTTRHKTPWGDAVNYDQEGRQGVRRYFIENALYWIRECHLDALRLDAVQTIKDDSSPHILAEIAENVDELAQHLGRQVCIVAETDENDSRIVRPRSPRGAAGWHMSGGSADGYGLDAIWSDDFHHAVHAFFTGEQKGYYQDFGRPEQIVRALNEGFVFQGEPFRFWQGRARGTSSRQMPAPAHVICLQNHDQVGNRAQGERLAVLVPRGARMLAAALLLLAPYTPLLFMGQEFDEFRPFQFFTDYGDPVLQKAVSDGRRNEFKDFNLQEIPDPQDPATFERSKLNWRLAQGENSMLDWYAALLALRKQYVSDAPRTSKAELREGVITMQVPAEHPRLKVFARIEGATPLPPAGAGWRQALGHEGDGFAISIWTLA